METLAYPHMTLAHNPQSDPAIASEELMVVLSNFLPNWCRTLSQPKLSSAGWVGLLAVGVASSSWVVGTAAIAQTNASGNSGVEFIERAMSGAEGNKSESSLKPLPNFQINNERPTSLADVANGATMGFLGGDGAFREDVRRPVSTTNGAPNVGPKAVQYGSVPQRLPGSGGYLRYGMRSPQVTQLQTQLRLLGYFQGQSDGYFGNSTLASVRAFQRDRGLAIDGVVGGNTRSALYSGAGSGGAPFTAPPRAVPQGVPRPVVNQQQQVISRPRPVSRPAPVYTSGSACGNYYTRVGHRKVSGSAYSGGCRIPCVGGKNQNVVALQNRLKTLGYFNFRSTGYYGPITRHAVIRFQRANGLRPDGIAGPRTKQALRLSI